MVRILSQHESDHILYMLHFTISLGKLFLTRKYSVKVFLFLLVHASTLQPHERILENTI